LPSALAYPFHKWNGNEGALLFRCLICANNRKPTFIAVDFSLSYP
jgi:hypothetical protein